MGTSLRHQDGNSPAQSTWDLKVSIPASPQPWRAERRQHLSVRGRRMEGHILPRTNALLPHLQE